MNRLLAELVEGVHRVDADCLQLALDVFAAWCALHRHDGVPAAARLTLIDRAVLAPRCREGEQVNPREGAS